MKYFGIKHFPAEEPVAVDPHNEELAATNAMELVYYVIDKYGKWMKQPSLQQDKYTQVVVRHKKWLLALSFLLLLAIGLILLWTQVDWHTQWGKVVVRSTNSISL